MSVPFPEPTAVAGSRAEVFERYLGFFHGRLAARLRELPSGELRRSRLPSGWTPLELLKHLTYVEMRWLERLRHIRSLLPSDSITGEPKLLLFSRQGFTPELTGEALSRPDVALIDLHRLYHGS
jgi:hypothetical protein